MIFDETVYLTTDQETRKCFIAEKCRPFRFTKRSTGEVVSTHWYSLPERLYDDPNELAEWASKALSVASTSKTTLRKQVKHSMPHTSSRRTRKA
jgi:DNA transformation protein